MASRRLALNLSQGLRGRAAGLAVPRRGLATPHHAPGITTQTTTLKNGLTVSAPPSSNSRAPIDQPSLSRSPRNIPPTPRLPPSACGSTLAPAQRLTRQMAPRTFSSISPSRCAPVPPVPLRRNRPADHHDPGHPEADTAAAGARDREHGRPPQRLYLGSSGPRPRLRPPTNTPASAKTPSTSPRP